MGREGLTEFPEETGPVREVEEKSASGSERRSTAENDVPLETEPPWEPELGSEVDDEESPEAELSWRLTLETHNEELPETKLASRGGGALCGVALTPLFLVGEVLWLGFDPDLSSWDFALAWRADLRLSRSSLSIFGGRSASNHASIKASWIPLQDMSPGRMLLWYRDSTIRSEGFRAMRERELPRPTALP